MRIMIVEDDYQIREGIRNAVEWETFGFDVVKTYADGEDAYKAMNEVNPDLILCDIEMPKMSGLELAQRLRDEKRDVKFIFLTAFSDFEYCQKALKLGADDYILKPVKLKVLQQSILVNVEKLNLKRRQERQYHEALLEEMAGKVYYDGRKDLQDQFILRVKNRYPLFDSQYMITVVLNYNGKEETDNRAEEILRQELLKMNCIMFSVRHGERICLGCADYSMLYSMNYRVKLQKVIENWCQKNGDAVLFHSAGISEVHRITGLLDGYRQAKQAAGNYFYEKRNINLYQRRMSKTAGSHMECDPENWREQVLSCVKEDELKRAEIVLNKMRDYFLRLEMSADDFRKQCAGIYRETMKMMKSAETSDMLEAELADCQDAEQCIRILVKYIETGRNTIHILEDGRRNEKISPPIEEAVNYITDHYKEPIQASQVAEHIGKTAGYFSMKFKQEMGIGFSQYLTKVRLENACQKLIHTNQKINEIGYSVGFQDYLYFSKIFRKVIGCSPTEVRNTRSIPQKRMNHNL